MENTNKNKKELTSRYVGFCKAAQADTSAATETL
jgi:hypothetical protein